jgi:hypothetical protein
MTTTPGHGPDPPGTARKAGRPPGPGIITSATAACPSPPAPGPPGQRHAPGTQQIPPGPNVPHAAADPRVPAMAARLCGQGSARKSGGPRRPGLPAIRTPNVTRRTEAFVRRIAEYALQDLPDAGVGRSAHISHFGATHGPRRDGRQAPDGPGGPGGCERGSGVGFTDLGQIGSDREWRIIGLLFSGYSLRGNRYAKAEAPDTGEPDCLPR